jgi:hypothetical protein
MIRSTSIIHDGLEELYSPSYLTCPSYPTDLTLDVVRAHCGCSAVDPA